jgi:predicted transcriptional regulator
MKIISRDYRNAGRWRRAGDIGCRLENAILDAIREAGPESIPASKLMVPAPIIVDANTSTDELINLLLKSCCSIILVVKNKKYVGVVSRHMLMDIFTSPHYSRFASKERKTPFACN